MKVRVNKWYTFRPVGWDVIDAKNTARIEPGQRVQVRNLPGCPPANTMGHAHVFDTAGQFVGMVSTASLIDGGNDASH